MKYKNFFSFLIIAVFFSTAFASSLAFADSYDFSNTPESVNNATRSRFGIDFERYKGGDSTSGTQGVMVGLSSATYLYKGFNIGYQFEVGAPTDGSIRYNNLFYGGLTLGYDHTFFVRFMDYDLRVLAGYGYGTTASVSGDSIAIQPSAAIGFVLVQGYRTSFGLSYLYTPSASTFSGVMFTIRFERKTDTPPSRPVDN